MLWISCFTTSVVVVHVHKLPRMCSEMLLFSLHGCKESCCFSFSQHSIKLFYIETVGSEKQESSSFWNTPTSPRLDFSKFWYLMWTLKLNATWLADWIILIFWNINMLEFMVKILKQAFLLLLGLELVCLFLSNVLSVHCLLFLMFLLFLIGAVISAPQVTRPLYCTTTSSPAGLTGTGSMSPVRKTTSALEPSAGYMLLT